MADLSKKRNRCADYVRVSTREQAQKEYSSCEVQHDQCMRLIEAHASDGWVSVFSEVDAGYSAATTKRPGFQRLLHAIQRREIDILVVYNNDRISRNATDYLNFLKFLDQHEVKLVSVTDPVDMKGAMGKFTRLMKAGLQEFERDQIIERTANNMQERARNGWWNGGNTPLGYRNVNKRLEIEPREAEIIRLIYTSAAAGVSLQAIADRLNQAGYRTKVRSHLRGGAKEPIATGGRLFRADHVALITKNPIYRGAIRWKEAEHKGKQPAIVDADLWDRANRAISAVGDKAPVVFRAQDRHHHLIKGLICCGHCGVSMIPHWTGKRSPSGTPYRYYECLRHARREPAGPQCAGRLPSDQIEGVVLSALNQLGTRPELLRATLAVARAGGRSEGQRLRRELTQADAELKEISAQISALIATIKTSKMAALEEELQAEADALGRKKAELLMRREQLAIRAARWRQSNPDPVEIARALEKFSDLVMHLSPSKRKELVQLLIERIDIRRLDAGVDRAAADAQMFTARLWCVLPEEPLREADARSQLEASTAKSRSARWQITVSFDLKRVGKGYRASLVEPFDQMVHAPAAETKPPAAPIEHPIAQALRWHEWRAQNPERKPADVARAFKVTRATVSLGLRLLTLSSTIREFLFGLKDPRAVRFFSRRRLLPLAPLAPNEQLRRFEKMKAEFTERMRAAA